MVTPRGRNSWIACLVVTAGLVSGPRAASNQETGLASAGGWGDAETHAYDETVQRALALLPRQPEKVIVIDADRTSPALRLSLRSVDGFVMRGDMAVYLRMQGALLQHAHRIGKSFDYALAAVIWHEMAHLNGADEREAQRQEEELWRQFLLQQRVEPKQALRYLSLLKKRHAP